MAYKAAVLTISDKGSRGERVDTSGPMLVGKLKDAGFDVVYTTIIPDEREIIANELIKCADEKSIALILTTGGTGFAKRDITPEATLDVIERETRGIPELMRAESCKITNRGCLSRGVAGIRGNSLIVNLPGSEKAARENFDAVSAAIAHGMDMLASTGSANCAENTSLDHHHHHHDKKEIPSMDAWIKEAKASINAHENGMYLIHNGVVRESARSKVREGDEAALPVKGMYFSYDKEKVDAFVGETYKMTGIFHIRVWLNEGELSVGDDIMYVLIGGDTRPHVIEALTTLVGNIKNNCVVEKELYN